MTKRWGPVDQRTFGFTQLIGPEDERVLLGTNFEVDPIEVFGVGDAVYGEQFVWRNAATGEELARSDFVDGMTIGTLPTPGYGGLAYMMQQDGGMVSFQVVK